MPGGLETTPLDELTGLPLPIFARSSDFYIRKKDDLELRPENYHHGFHPNKSILLGYSEEGILYPKGSEERISGRALRYSRGQIVPIWLHSRYHDLFYGPELPEDVKGRFTRVVLACAGVVPRQAIDLRRPGEYKITPDLSDRAYSQITRRIHYEGEITPPKYPDRRGELGRFIADYAINNSLNQILSESEVRAKVKEFLMPRSDRARKEAGRIILAHAVDASVAELIDVFETAKKEKMVQRATNLGSIVLQYFTPDRFGDYFAPLEDRLATANI